MRKMFEALPVSGPPYSMTSVAVFSARSVVNAFCISKVQHKPKTGCAGFHSEFAAVLSHTYTHQYEQWTELSI